MSLTRLPSVRTPEAPTLRPEPLARQLSALGVWLLVINGIIGAGIFGLPADAARLAGSFSPWVFVICAALMLPVMLSFAELASHFDGTGGPVRYAGSVFGRYAGFQAGWAFYIARLTAFSANAVLLVSAIGYFWPGADDPGVRLALLFSVCAGLTAITVVGTRNAMSSLGVLTLLKFVPLVALVAYGLLRLPDAMRQSVLATPPVDVNLGAVVLLVFYAFVGFESGLVPAGEARNPRRDMPRALFWAIGVVAILYFGLQTVSLAVLPDLAITKRPLVEVSGELFGPVGALCDDDRHGRIGRRKPCGCLVLHAAHYLCPGAGRQPAGVVRDGVGTFQHAERFHPGLWSGSLPAGRRRLLHLAGGPECAHTRAHLCGMHRSPACAAQARGR